MVESGEGLGAHAGSFNPMVFFGCDEPAPGLFAHDVLMAVNQSANGQPALVSFGYSRHMGNFPHPAQNARLFSPRLGDASGAEPASVTQAGGALLNHHIPGARL